MSIYTYHADANVFLNCFSYVNKGYPKQVYGALLGLAIDIPGSAVTRVEVTSTVLTQDRTVAFNVASRTQVDTLPIGWFESTVVDNEAELIEKLIAAGKTMKLSPIVIRVEPFNNETNKPPYRAYKLSDEFKKKLKLVDGLTNDVVRSVTNCLTEVEIEITCTGLQAAFMYEWTKTDATVHEARHEMFHPLRCPDYKSEDRAFDHLMGSIQMLGPEQEKVQKYLKDSARHEQKIKEWMERRRIDNDARVLENLEPLPVLMSAAIKAVGIAPVVPSVLPVTQLSRQAVEKCHEINLNTKEAILKQKLLHEGFL